NHVASSGNWYRIPKWAAGRWKQETMTQFHSKNLFSGADTYEPYTYKFAIGGRYGVIKDRAGGVWDLQGPGANIGEGDNDLVVEIIDDVAPLATSENELVLRYRSKNVTVSKATKRIKSTEQIECISKSTQAGQLMKNVSSIKTFDENGSPLRTGDT